MGIRAVRGRSQTWRALAIAALIVCGGGGSSRMLHDGDRLRPTGVERVDRPVLLRGSYKKATVGPTAFKSEGRKARVAAICAPAPGINDAIVGQGVSSGAHERAISTPLPCRDVPKGEPISFAAPKPITPNRRFVDAADQN